MALYLGEERMNLHLNDLLLCLNIYSPSDPITEVIRLLSSDNYILKDLNDIYLIPKEVE